MSMRSRDVAASGIFAAVMTALVAVTETMEVPPALSWVSVPGFAAVAWLPGFGVHGTSSAAVIAASFFVYFVIAILGVWVIRRIRRSSTPR